MHRFHAINHLHEAEDESQQWPELHGAIRAARKAYQREGTLPDFNRLATLLAHIRLAHAAGISTPMTDSAEAKSGILRIAREDSLPGSV